MNQMAFTNGLSDYETDSSSNIGVLTRPKTQRNDSGSGDRYAHYVSAKRLSAARVTGQPVVALCGKVWVPTRLANQHPICPRCKEIKAQMDKNGGPGWPFRGPGMGGEQ